MRPRQWGALKAKSQERAKDQLMGGRDQQEAPCETIEAEMGQDLITSGE